MSVFVHLIGVAFVAGNTAVPYPSRLAHYVAFHKTSSLCTTVHITADG